ncbi:hypothetical protein [Streptomyces globisporus]|uniref:hypothetical protein n=1 Tax=Streptomyces globisporus TaxID=1908 RepID=UPI0004C9EF80|nr:hypothetical protein [Streptomyces globisporus]
MAVVALGVVGGLASVFLIDSGYMPWFSMTTAWEALHDRSAYAQGNRAWLAGDTVARSRFDAATGDEEDDRAFRDHVVGYGGELGDLFTYEDRVIGVRWGSGERPLSVYERW